MKATFKRGVHLNYGSKEPTKHLHTRDFVSDTVQLIMSMHIGAPSEPCVKKGDLVKLGQVIGTPVGFLGIPVHASVSGEVVAVERIPYLMEEPVMAVTIRNDFLDEWTELHPLGSVESVDPAKIVPAIREAGICGMGGASFPTHVKLSLKSEQKCEMIIVNGAECETHLTCDHRLMLESPGRVVDGLRAAMRALNVKKGVIAIEDNKPDAIESMRRAANGRDGVSVRVLKTKYPQGGEKQLIEAVAKQQVPVKKLPIDVGVIVLNVGTCAAIADAVIDGKPLISRITTVTGCVRSPANLRLRIGTIAEDIIGACGGFSDTPGKIAFGGGMTGLCLPNIYMPMTKSTNGIVVYNEKDARSVEEGPCIRCGHCVAVCPIGLNPYQMKVAADADKLDMAEKLHVTDCILCGCCSYECPSRRWLTASFKIVKQKLAQRAERGELRNESASFHRAPYPFAQDDHAADAQRAAGAPAVGCGGRVVFRHARADAVVRVHRVGCRRRIPVAEARSASGAGWRPVRGRNGPDSGIDSSADGDVVDGCGRQRVRDYHREAAVRRHRRQLSEPRHGGARGAFSFVAGAHDGLCDREPVRRGRGVDRHAAGTPARRAHIPIWSCFWEMCRARSAKPASSRFWRDCFFCF